MIISYHHNFIFFHCRKTAGSSVALALLKVLESPDIFCDNIQFCKKLPPHLESVNPLKHLGYTKSIMDNLQLAKDGLWYVGGKEVKGSKALLKAIVNRCYYKYGIAGGVHATAEQVKQAIGEEAWDKMFKFCFIRNPWDFLVSFYFWRSKDVPHLRPSFKEFVGILYRGETDSLPFNTGGFRNWDMYTIDDKVVVDYIGRFDHLDDDFNMVLQKIDISENICIPKKNSKSRPDKASLSQMYDEETLLKVREMFKKEIEYFGWQEPLLTD